MSKRKDILRSILIPVLVIAIVAICVLAFFLNKENKSTANSAVASEPNAVGNSAIQMENTQDGVASTDDTRINTSDDLETIMESRQVEGMEELECIASCYDTSTVSEVKYTGIPQVDNCIHTLLGSGEYKPMEDADDYIDDYPVHIYVIDVNNKVFSIIYYEDIEAIAIPLDMTPAEYYSGYEIDTSEED